MAKQNFALAIHVAVVAIFSFSADIYPAHVRKFQWLNHLYSFAVKLLPAILNASCFI